MNIQLTSPAFKEGATIPRLYTCDDKNITPPLNWTGVPESAESLVIIMDDPDAPAGTWTHWILYDIHGDVNGFMEGNADSGKAGMNDFGRSAYGGPCPPKGSNHRYYIRIYALDVRLDLNEGASRKEVENLMEGHVIAQGELMGKYGR